MNRRNVLLVLAAMSAFLGAGHATSAQNLFVDDWGSGTIHQFSPTGTDLGIFASPSNLNGSLSGLAVNSIGDVFQAGVSGKIHKYSSTGADLGTFSTGLGNLYGLRFNSSGNLLASSGNTIHQFSPSGADLGTFATGLSAPVFLAFSPVPTATPEPGSLALLAGILVSCAVFARRRRR
ncbi:MAG: hypothetical protein JWN14_1326 [Chthonomonadales bacterium]|nr:hypothetical protein [Chthonomonadales bacterium]